MTRKVLYGLVLGLLAIVVGTLTGQPADVPAYRNPDLPAEKRAADLVGRMTLEEKFSQMQDNAAAIPPPEVTLAISLVATWRAAS